MRILMHLRPDWESLHGGDLVQLQRWAVWLQELGLDVEVSDAPQPDLRGVDLVHFHNLGRAFAHWDVLKHCRRAGVPAVLTPLYWPTDEYERLGRPGWQGLASRFLPAGWRERLKTAVRLAPRDRQAAWRALRTDALQRIRAFVSRFDGLVVNSLAEVEALQELTAKLPPTFIVHSGVDAFYWSPDRSLWALEGDWLLPNGQRRRTPLSEFEDVSLPPQREGVLCVARFDPQKAQHRLIQALRPLNLPLTLAGADNPNYPTYRAYCQRLAGPQVRILPRVSPRELKALFHGCQVHVLASWYETTGLTALEAGCCGARSVVAARGGTRDYAERLAWYAHPREPVSVRRAVERALAAPTTPDLLSRVRQRFTWELSAIKLARAYRAVLEGRPSAGFTSSAASPSGSFPSAS